MPNLAEERFRPATYSQQPPDDKIINDLLRPVQQYDQQITNPSKKKKRKKYLGQFSQVQQSFASVPKASEVRHHHHFDLRSKGFMISAAVLLLSTAISIAVAISNYKESNRLQESDIKFRVTRQLSPVLTARVDSIYYEDPERAELETQKREAHELTVKEAEAQLMDRRIEVKAAENILKQLKTE